MSNKGLFAFILLQGLLCAAEPMTLTQAYELALKNEPRLRSAALKLSANAETIQQATAKLYPQLQASISWGRYEYEYKSSAKPIKENYTDYSISAVQPLFHPEHWREIDQAKTRQSAAVCEYHAKAQQLGLELAKAYFTVLRGNKGLEWAYSQKKYYAQKYQKQQEMLKFGLTNRIDLLETKIALDKATSEALVEEKRVQVAKLRLEHMTGKKIALLSPFDFECLDDKDFKMSRAEWEAKISQNPTLKAAMLNTDTAKDEVAIRHYDHYPKVDFNLMRKQTNTNDPNSHLYDNQAIIRMSVPIYSGGMTQSRVREGMLLLDSALKEEEYYEQDIKAKFAEVWEERQYSIDNFNTIKESEKSAALYLESIEKAHLLGIKSIVDVLEARSKLYEIKRDLVDVGYELINNHLKLLETAGELNGDTIHQLENLLTSK